ncbi:MAG: hypothetical protein ACK56F_23460, partial [bacterium]
GNIEVLPRPRGYERAPGNDPLDPREADGGRGENRRRQARAGRDDREGDRLPLSGPDQANRTVSRGDQ